MLINLLDQDFRLFLVAENEGDVVLQCVRFNQDGTGIVLVQKVVDRGLLFNDRIVLIAFQLIDHDAAVVVRLKFAQKVQRVGFGALIKAENSAFQPTPIGCRNLADGEAGIGLILPSEFNGFIGAVRDHHCFYFGRGQEIRRWVDLLDTIFLIGQEIIKDCLAIRPGGSSFGNAAADGSGLEGSALQKLARNSVLLPND